MFNIVDVILNFLGYKDREVERQHKHKEYVDVEYTKATNSTVMKGVSLVLYDDCEYRIEGLCSDKKPLPPTLYMACNSHYNETSAKEHYLKLYHYRLQLEHNKNRKPVEVK